MEGGGMRGEVTLQNGDVALSGATGRACLRGMSRGAKRGGY